jgi:hypothetical protein
MYTAGTAGHLPVPAMRYDNTVAISSPVKLYYHTPHTESTAAFRRMCGGFIIA